MKVDSSIELSFWEKLTDGLSAVGEGVASALGRIFGSSNDRVVRAIGFVRPKHAQTHQIVSNSQLDKIVSLEETMSELRSDEFERLTQNFRERLGVEHTPLKKRTMQGNEILANPEVEGHSEAFQSLIHLMDQTLPATPTLDDLLPYAFAACREAGKRTKNMRHYDTQLVGGIVLHNGNIAEMVTGEGKTLVATLPAYLNALTKLGVHVITVNDYLARRDCEWMSPIYHLLGISCGFIQSDMDPVARATAYNCDITYGTNSEFGFDYLRDNMKPARWGDNDYDPFYQQCQRALNFAIIDEVDNILIDEARTPLIISGPAHGDLNRYKKANDIAVKLSELERKAQAKLKEVGHGLDIPEHPLNKESENGDGEHADGSEEINVNKIQLPEEGKEKRLGYYFEVREKERTCHLTDEGIRKAEELAGVESFYTAGNMEWPHLIDNALKAHHLYHKDKQYVVMPHPETREMAVIIVDEFTGRLMVGRQWSDGLHQAVEAKHWREGAQIKEESQTLATVTLQNFFKLYKKLAGMTGTAMTEANEFWKIYKLDVVAIPTNKPLIRHNYSDVIYLSEKEKWEAVVDEVERINKWDVIRLKDGTELVGTIKNETDTSVDLLLKENNQKRTVTEEEVAKLDRRGRPILIGTTDVAKSEKVSSLLKRRGIKHELLNAKPEYAAREAEIVAQAGRMGSVTISTNMAGRGTDIILGGNAETLAWARLKDSYPTRLDVPDEVWKQTVSEIKTKEKMEEEGRHIAEMGGLHIVGTERHEARRIDNQLRGRAGRQGDPGSGRFFLSLEDDLMRIFAGEWVKKVLTSMGMEYGQSIESRMVSRRIEAAQKKVEEKNFDIRKHLLEYDEVMDHQRKRTYGFRQEILEGANCKARILEMIQGQVEMALDRYLADGYGAECFAQLAQDRLGMEMEPRDFVRCDFEEADRLAKERAFNNVPTQIHEMLDENLPHDAEDQSEWNWQALASGINGRYGLHTTDRQLKKMGRDGIGEYVLEEARKSIDEVDLSKGAEYLSNDWGLIAFAGWANDKFGLKLEGRDFAEKKRGEIRDLLMTKIREIYRAKEIEFPVTLAMTSFMADKGQGTQQRYDRDGLLAWFKTRFPHHVDAIPEEKFRTESRTKLRELLLEVSRKQFPEGGHEEIDTKLTASFAGTRVSEAGDAEELAEWIKNDLGFDIKAEELTGLSLEEARDKVWNAFDRYYRPEMRRMERSLLLSQLDQAWKNHLYQMDHLRQGIGLVGYAQVDPKTEYKRQGMKEFDAMWENLEDKMTTTVFRMEDDEAFQDSIWAITAAVHEAAPRAVASAGIQGEQEQAMANRQSEKKPEPIRNFNAKVGRNDPCPCGSGKKYKNCCMSAAAK